MLASALDVMGNDGAVARITVDEGDIIKEMQVLDSCRLSV
jgi:hypothetical protein